MCITSSKPICYVLNCQLTRLMGWDLQQLPYKIMFLYFNTTNLYVIILGVINYIYNFGR